MKYTRHMIYISSYVEKLNTCTMEVSSEYNKTSRSTEWSKIGKIKTRTKCGFHVEGLTWHDIATKKDPDRGDEWAKHHHEANEQPETSSCKDTYTLITVISSLATLHTPTAEYTYWIIFGLWANQTKQSISSCTVANRLEHNTNSIL